MWARKTLPYLKPLPLDAHQKLSRHIDAIFGEKVSEALPPDLQFEFSRKTGRIKNFSIAGRLMATLRTDGGLALSLRGAQFLARSSRQFRENCIIPQEEAVPFVVEGRSLFCRHVEWCGTNVRVGSDVAILDGRDDVIAVGVAVLGHGIINKLKRGVAVKVREGIKGRTA